MISVQATLCLALAGSPITHPENITTQTSVSPENGANIEGLAYFIASTQNSGFRNVIPIIPLRYNAQGIAFWLCFEDSTIGDVSLEGLK
jgi:hypothetical protein